jgi:uroporphyrinogen-III synthase
MRLLVTRPEPDAERTAAALRAKGHEAVVASVLRVEPVAADFGRGPFAGVIMTSANAANAIAAHPRLAELTALPVFAVGTRTADAAHQAGFATVASAGGGWAKLVRLIAARVRDPGARLLYVAAEDRSGDIPGALAASGLAVETVVLYRAVAAPGFARSLQAALEAGRLDGVLHYSRRSAQAFVAGATAAGLLPTVLKVRHYCLAVDVAFPLETAGARVRIAARPEEAALIELLSFDC